MTSLPAVKMAMTVARAMTERGEGLPPNIAFVVMEEVRRLKLQNQRFDEKFVLMRNHLEEQEEGIERLTKQLARSIPVVVVSEEIFRALGEPGNLDEVLERRLGDE